MEVAGSGGVSPTGSGSGGRGHQRPLSPVGLNIAIGRGCTVVSAFPRDRHGSMKDLFVLFEVLSTVYFA